MVMLHFVIVDFCGVLVFVFWLYVLCAFTCIHLWTPFACICLSKFVCIGFEFLHFAFPFCCYMNMIFVLFIMFFCFCCCFRIALF